MLYVETTARPPYVLLRLSALESSEPPLMRVSYREMGAPFDAGAVYVTETELDVDVPHDGVDGVLGGAAVVVHVVVLE